MKMSQKSYMSEQRYNDKISNMHDFHALLMAYLENDHGYIYPANIQKE